MCCVSVQAEVPVQPGRAAGAGWRAQVLQEGTSRLRPAAVLQRLPLQAVLRHPRLLLPGETSEWPRPHSPPSTNTVPVIIPDNPEVWELNTNLNLNNSDEDPDLVSLGERRVLLEVKTRPVSFHLFSVAHLVSTLPPPPSSCRTCWPVRSSGRGRVWCSPASSPR